jgi:hypothetical protein
MRTGVISRMCALSCYGPAAATQRHRMLEKRTCAPGLSHEKVLLQFLMYSEGSDVNKRELAKSGVNIPKPWEEEQCSSLQHFASRLRWGRA